MATSTGDATMSLSVARMLLLCALLTLTTALDHTHVNNLSSKDICATTSYFIWLPGWVGTGSSQFVQRKIPAHNSDVDEYNTVDQVRVEMWVLAAGQSCADATGVHSTISIGSDNSVTAQDNADGQGVDVFNAGTDNKLQGLAFTIYNAPTFASAAPSDTLPDTARLATLQDATNPHLNLGSVLAANAVALLVDGWITGSNGQFASGTSDRTDLNAKLGILDMTQPVDGDGLGPDPDVDEVPLNADPNGGLAAYINTALPPAALAARGATFAPYPGTKQAGLIKDIISEWTLTQIDNGLGQKTLIGPTSDNPYRIDLQTNGAFPQQFKDENGNPITVSCYQVAVQIGNQVYAAAIVPAGQFVSAGGVRKALYNSFSQSKMVSFIPAPKRYNGVYKWVIAIGAGAAAAFTLIGSG